MNSYTKRLQWLARHGFRLRRAGLSWAAVLHGRIVNYNRNKRELVRDTFREYGLGVSC